MHSAESALAAAGRADSTFIWLFGDDDRPRPGALRSVLAVVSRTSSDAVLLNVELQVQGFPPRSVLPTGRTARTVRLGRAVWKHLGFLSATTTISAWVLRRDLIDLSRSSSSTAISPIYSHSFYLFSLLHNRQVSCMDEPCLIKHEEEIADVQDRFDALALEAASAVLVDRRGPGSHPGGVGRHRNPRGRATRLPPIGDHP